MEVRTAVSITCVLIGLAITVAYAGKPSTFLRGGEHQTNTPGVLAPKVL